MVKEFIEGMDWWRGKMTYFRFPARASFGRCSVGMASLPKMGGRWLGPLDACQKRKWRETQILIRSSKGERLMVEPNELRSVVEERECIGHA